MSKKQVIKEIFNEKINKDKIYQKVLLKVKEESNAKRSAGMEVSMNKLRNKKVIYWMLSSCAMLIICAVVVTNNVGDGKQNVTTGIEDKYAVTEDLSKEKQNDEININKIEEMHSAKIDAEIKPVSNNINIPYYEALANLAIPKDFDDKDQINIVYVKSDRDKDEYDKLFNYQNNYQNNNRDITIQYSKENKPMRDYSFENGKASKINGFDIVIYQHEASYITSFNYDNLNIDIETNNITQDELIALLESIIKEKNNLPVKEQDANINEQTNENVVKGYPNYYAGKYVDNNGNNVILLCEDTKANRKEICKKLKITEDKTIFKTAKYSYNYLTELQNRISKKMINKEFTFVSSSALMEDKNNIQVTVTSNNESDLSKIKTLDTIGGAIDIQYSDGGTATQDLLVEKE